MTVRRSRSSDLAFIRFRREKRIIENLTASQVELTDDEFTALETELNKCKVYGHRGLGGF